MNRNFPTTNISDFAGFLLQIQGDALKAFRRLFENDYGKEMLNSFTA